MNFNVLKLVWSFSAIKTDIFIAGGLVKLISFISTYKYPKLICKHFLYELVERT